MVNFLDPVTCLHHPLQCHAIEGCAIPIPRSEADSQDALNGTSAELFEDLRAYAKPFQPPEGEEVLLRLFHDCACGPI